VGEKRLGKSYGRGWVNEMTVDIHGEELPRGRGKLEERNSLGPCGLYGHTGETAGGSASPPK